MSDSITVKLIFKGEVRRFSLQHPTELSIQWLTHKAAHFQPTPEPANPTSPGSPARGFTITYVDDEHDRVTVSTDEDLTEALRVFLASGKKTLRFDLLTDSDEGSRATYTQRSNPPPLARVFIDVLNDPGLIESVGGLLNAFGFRGAPGCCRSTGPDTSETKENENEPKAVHHSVTCDVCGMSPIIGPRFKCTVRENYDMCEACEATAEPRLPSVKILAPSNPLADILNKMKKSGCFQQGGGCRRTGNPMSEFAADHPVFELWKQKCAQFANAYANEGPKESESKDTEAQIIEAALRASLEEPTTSAPTPIAAPAVNEPSSPPAESDRETAAPAQASGFDASLLDAWRAELAVIAGIGLDEEAAIRVLPKHIRTPAALAGGMINARGLDRAIDELLAFTVNH